MEKKIVICPSVHYVIAAEKLCRGREIPVQVIPMPRTISKDCGVALEIDGSDGERVGLLLKNAGIGCTIFNGPGEGGGHES